MAYKADLINNVVAHIHNLPDALNGDVTEVLVGVCEVSTHNLQKIKASTYIHNKT